MRFRNSAYVALGVVSLALVQCGGEATPEPESPTPASLVTSEPAPEPAPAMTADPNAPPASMAEPQAAPTTPAAEPLSDDQIATITDSANSAEIEQAKIAQTKAKNARVRKFAAMMIADHTQAKQKQNKLKLSAQESPLSTQLGVENSSMLSTLKGTTGADFDRVYMSGQVEAHRKLLDAIDSRLLPNVQNAELKALIQEIRPKVEMHLKEAQEIQQSLGVSSVEQGSMKGTGTTGSGTDTSMGGDSKTGTGSGAGKGTSTGTSKPTTYDPSRPGGTPGTQPGGGTPR